MLVLGIDPGTATTGYAVVLGGECECRLLDSGALLTQAGRPPGERLQGIYQGVLALARQHKPDAAAVEELFFSRNVRTALAVGQARGVVLLALTDAGVPVFEYTPNQVKESVTGYGNAGKRQVQEMVRMLLRLSEVLQPDDAADAAAIALCHLQHYRFDQALAEAEG